MTYTQTGWLIALAAAGMLASLIGTEMASLHSWDEVWTVPFLGKTLLHIATVIGAWVSGKLMPQPPGADPDPDWKP